MQKLCFSKPKIVINHFLKNSFVFRNTHSHLFLEKPKYFFLSKEQRNPSLFNNTQTLENAIKNENNVQNLIKLISKSNSVLEITEIYTLKKFLFKRDNLFVALRILGQICYKSQGENEKLTNNQKYNNFLNDIFKELERANELGYFLFFLHVYCLFCFIFVFFIHIINALKKL